MDQVEKRSGLGQKNRWIMAKRGKRALVWQNRRGELIRESPGDLGKKWSVKGRGVGRGKAP